MEPGTDGSPEVLKEMTGLPSNRLERTMRVALFLNVISLPTKSLIRIKHLELAFPMHCTCLAR